MDAPRYTDGNVTVMVNDVAEATRFYTEVLGLHLKRRSPDGWVEVEAPGMTIGLHKSVGIPAGTHGSMTVGLGVPDLDAAVAALKAKGVRFGDTRREGAVRMAFFHDPDDNTLYLVQSGRPPGARSGEPVKAWAGH